MDWISLDNKPKPARSLFSQQRQVHLCSYVDTPLIDSLCDPHRSWMCSCCPFCRIFFTFFVLVLPCFGWHWKNAGVSLRVWPWSYLCIPACLKSFDHNVSSTCTTFSLTIFEQVIGNIFLEDYSAQSHPANEVSPYFNNKWSQTVRI